MYCHCLCPQCDKDLNSIRNMFEKGFLFSASPSDSALRDSIPSMSKQFYVDEEGFSGHWE